MQDIIVADEQKLIKIIAALKNGGAGNLHVLSDFDRTLTRACSNGIPVPSLISVLYDHNYLTPEYSRKSKTLERKYRPIEDDPDIPLEIKKIAMLEWWQKQFDLLVKSGLDRNDIKNIVSSDIVKFRAGIGEFAAILAKNNIPLVVMSASGMGAEAIKMAFGRIGADSSNLKIISNEFIWDKNGYAIGVKQPIIHAFNKDETTVKEFPEIYDVIKNRKNVVLLGDNPEDVKMVCGFNYDNLLSIGFYNRQGGEWLEKHKKVFDIVIANDAGLDYVNQLLGETTRTK